MWGPASTVSLPTPPSVQGEVARKHTECHLAINGGWSINKGRGRIIGDCFERNGITELVRLDRLIQHADTSLFYQYAMLHGVPLPRDDYACYVGIPQMKHTYYCGNKTPDFYSLCAVPIPNCQ